MTVWKYSVKHINRLKNLWTKMRLMSRSDYFHVKKRKRLEGYTWVKETTQELKDKWIHTKLKGEIRDFPPGRAGLSSQARGPWGGRCSRACELGEARPPTPRPPDGGWEAGRPEPRLVCPGSWGGFVHAREQTSLSPSQDPRLIFLFSVSLP